MEHEDNSHFDYLQNAQNLMENVQQQIASGGGGGGDVGEEIVGSIGGKFEEREEHDDEEEWKYIREGQQSEKQQTAVDGEKGIGNGNVDVGRNIGVDFSFGVDGGFVDGHQDVLLCGQQQQQQHNVDGVVPAVGNGDADFGFGFDNFSASGAVGSVAATHDNDDGTEKEVEVIKNDGEFSTTSNTTSTPTEDDVAVGVPVDLLQVEMKIESDPANNADIEEQQLLLQTEHEHEYDEKIVSEFGANAGSGAGAGRGNVEGEEDDEEPSSMATNTTNGRSSSLSENLLQQPDQQQQLDQQQQPEQQQLPELQQQHDIYDLLEDKENDDPLTADAVVRPTGFDVEIHSQLNPDAKEFVPTFGSQPTSPTSPAPPSVPAAIDTGSVGEPAGTSVPEPHPNAIPRHLLANDEDDDFVAHSPRKGRGFDMEGVPLPTENEFESEAAKRPHELKEEDMLIPDVSPSKNDQQEHNGVVSDAVPSAVDTGDDCMDFQRESPASFVDHGPETSVDLDMPELTGLHQSEDADDVVKRLLFIANTEDNIEQLLNTVQPVPADGASADTSMTEAEMLPGVKESFNVEEKEHVSQSPSMVEDLHQMPSMDMNNAFIMQESFYVENRPTESTGLNLLADNSNPIDDKNVDDGGSSSFLDASIEAARSAPAAAHVGQEFILSPEEEIMNEQNKKFDNFLTAPDEKEKHLLEETKEQLEARDEVCLTDNMGHLEERMTRMLLNADGNQSQVEEPAFKAEAITQMETPIFAQESEQQQHQQPDPEQLIPTESSRSTADDDLAHVPGAEVEIAAVAEPIVDETAAEPIVDEAAAAELAAAAAAAVAAATVTVNAASKKLEAVKKSSAPKASASAVTAAKPKPGDSKKPEVKKSTTSGKVAPAAGVAATARPRTAPAKTTTTTASLASRKPLTAAAKAPASLTGPKTGLSAKPSTSRPAPSVAARKTLSSGSSATTNGAMAPAPKPRPTSAGGVRPSKPATLVAPNAKPKLTSPRSTVASQLRKVPAAGGAKSPTKSAPTAPSTTAGVARTSTLTSRTKTGTSSSASTTTTATTVTITKTFHARPAPKTTSVPSTLPAITRRTASAGTRTTTAASGASNGTAGNKPTTLAVSAAASKKSPLKLSVGGVSPMSKLSPTKSATGAVASPRTKAPIGRSSVKSSPVTLKQKQAAAAAPSPKANGVQKQKPNEPQAEQKTNGGGIDGGAGSAGQDPPLIAMEQQNGNTHHEAKEQEQQQPPLHDHTSLQEQPNIGEAALIDA